jgi:nitroreductase
MKPSDRDIEKLVIAGNSAPSAGNLKARRIFVIRSSAKRSELVEAALGQSWISEAPFVLLFCADNRAIMPYGIRGKELYCIQDATISASFSMLKATELGLATCWVGAFDDVKVSEAAGLPEHLRPVAILTVGYEK